MSILTRHPFRSLLLVLAALLAAVILAAIALTLLWPADDLRKRISDAAGERMAVPITIEGDASLRFWPRPTVRVGDVTLGAESGSDAAAGPTGHLAAARLSLRWLPLLRGRLVPATLHLDAPVLRLERDAAGAMNIDPGTAEDGTQPLALGIRDGEVHWHDRDRDRQVSVTGLDVTSPRLQWRPAGDGRHPLAAASLSLDVSADTVSLQDLTISEPAFTLSARDGVFRIEDGTMGVLGDSGTVRARADFGASPASWTLDLDFGALQAEAVPEAWLHGGSIAGDVALAASLVSHGDEWDAVLRHMDGEVRLEARDMRVNGLDLDEELSAYRRTQRFTLVDAAAVLFAGPIGVAATKGSEFARLLDRADGETEIVHLVSAWEVEDGTAHARDVAMATTRNRIAARASLDLSTREIGNGAVAVIGSEGCALIHQTVHGTLDEPVIEEPSLVAALLGAPLDLVRQGLGVLAVGEGDCEVFYDGIVAAPQPDDA